MGGRGGVNDVPTARTKRDGGRTFDRGADVPDDPVGGELHRRAGPLLHRQLPGDLATIYTQQGDVLIRLTVTALAGLPVDQAEGLMRVAPAKVS